MKNNNDIFNRVWNQAKQYGLAFISSNGGTGKTTFFQFKLLRDALEKNVTFHIFVRFSYEMLPMAERFIKAQPTYSKRKLSLLSKLSVKNEGDKFIYIIESETGRKLAQVVNVNGQAFYKKFGNTINATRALFDEVLSENGDYCSDELNKFNRLVFTMARANPYHVFCLYNNTSPNFDYFSYYGGRSYNTHISKSGALFLYFSAAQFNPNETQPDAKSIQHIISATDYNSVYTANSFARYPVFFDSVNLRGAPILFKLEIENRLFKVRIYDGRIYIDADGAYKQKLSKKIYSINDMERTKYKQLPLKYRYALAEYLHEARLKTNDINNTIFVKRLSEKC